MFKKFVVSAVTVAVFVMAAGVALATVAFDPVTGTGFVGKGDLQTPWGWSNATLQAQAENITFIYEAADTADYDVTCEWDTGTRHVVHHVIETTATINATVVYDVKSASRKNPKGMVTGFFLLGDEDVSTTGDAIPVVGDPCLGNSGLGAITDVSDPYNQTTNNELDAYDDLLGLGPTAIWLNGASVL